MHGIVEHKALPEDAWKDLNARFRAPLTAYFQRRLHDRGDAEDLAQEVFVRLAARRAVRRLQAGYVLAG